jgi:hypothetical protein
MRRRSRVEVHFADGRVMAAGGVKAARELARSVHARMPAEIWNVSANDVGIGQLVDRVDSRPTARH